MFKMARAMIGIIAVVFSIQPLVSWAGGGGHGGKAGGSKSGTSKSGGAKGHTLSTAGSKTTPNKPEKVTSPGCYICV